MSDCVKPGSWKPEGAGTLVGSMPHLNREYVINLILEKLQEIPVWPQLPKYPDESMMVQYMEGLPGVVRKDDNECIVDTSMDNFESKLQEFYETYFEILENPERIREAHSFAFGRETTGATFYKFLEIINSKKSKYKAIKGQVTGPFTLLSATKNQDGKLILYDDKIQDAVPKHLALKALWQAKQLEPFAERVIIFFDEPALAGYGSSAFISISEDFILNMFNELCNILKPQGYLTGIHVCANTDWSLILNSSIDIVNFDAYNFGDKFILYKKDILNFVEKGGIIAWGIIPTDDKNKIQRENPENLSKLFMTLIQQLVSDSEEKKLFYDQSIITPSCGCGTLDEKHAEQVLELLNETVKILRREFYP